MNQGERGHTAFKDAEGYDRGINWEARLNREIPVLMDVLGPPGEGGVVDAGCGTGRQAVALAKRGYRVVGADASEEMIAVARRLATAESADVTFHAVPYAEFFETLGGGFDGLYCLGNALAAGASKDVVRGAIDQFARCLRPGGRIFIQVLNFAPMRRERPCVRGPRVSVVDGRERISIRQFHFDDEGAEVTNVTLWNDNGWHQSARSGRLYPVELETLRDWCASAGFRIDDLWGNYAREPFEPDSSVDLLVAATRVGI